MASLPERKEETMYNFVVNSRMFTDYPTFSLDDNPDIVEVNSYYVASSGDTYRLLKNRKTEVYYITLNDYVLAITLVDTLAYLMFDRCHNRTAINLS